jgi:hypothetical protein
MRRIIAGVLLATVLAQSSSAMGLADGNTRESTSSLYASIAGPLRDMWIASAPYALFTGHLDRYEATHGLLPSFRACRVRSRRCSSVRCSVFIRSCVKALTFPRRASRG